MGGKRPDQYRIDPGEAGATDYKDRREDAGILEQNKQDYTNNRADIEEGFIPKAGENPALAELRERKDASEKARAEEAGEAGADDGERAD